LSWLAGIATNTEAEMPNPKAKRICAQCGAGPSSDPPGEPPSLRLEEGPEELWFHPQCFRFWKNKGQAMPEYTEWTSFRKIIDYHMPNMPDADRQIFNAVISGDVRARFKGKIFGPEWRKQLSKFKPDESNPFALPPDIEISTEDARRKWAK
jgi:hypothetical protein